MIGVSSADASAFGNGLRIAAAACWKALHLALQNSKCLLDVVVSHEYLHALLPKVVDANYRSFHIGRNSAKFRQVLTWRAAAGFASPVA